MCLWGTVKLGAWHQLGRYFTGPTCTSSGRFQTNDSGMIITPKGRVLSTEEMLRPLESDMSYACLST